MPDHCPVAELLKNRTSSRAFLDLPVEEKILQEIFSLAQKSPSNCNVQPWQSYVVSGEQKYKLQINLIEEAMKGEEPAPDFDWSVSYTGVHRQRQHGAAHELYNAMGIERGDKAGRQQAMLRNWEFFDAPHVVLLCMDRYLGIMGAVDMGIYAQTLSLLMAERGIGSCMQGALGMYPAPIHQQLALPENLGVLFGISFGYSDPAAKANQARPQREATDHAVSFLS